MSFITLAKRQLTTINEPQIVIENEPPACLAILYELNKNLLEKYSQSTTRKAVSDDETPHLAPAQTLTPPSKLFNFNQIARNSLHFTTNRKTPLSAPELTRKSKNQAPPKSTPAAGTSSATDVDQTSDTRQPIEGYYYFHVTSKSHVDAHILKRDEVKQIFEGECIHYARVFEIAITNYCIMDNHFHLKIGVPARGITFEEARKRCAKAVGCMKQQFTNRFKIWYNGDFRREKGHRIPKLGGGSMWAGSLRIEHVHDEAYQAAATIYVEANRIKVSCAEIIEQLDTPPQPINESARECYGLTNGYDELFKKLLENKFQSAQAYLNEELRHNTALTDGLDAVWATPEEVDKLWHLPACKLPASHRKVHVNQERRILKTTPSNLRTYHTTPFIQRLGRTTAARQQKFVQLVLTCCWKSRHSTCSSEQRNYIANTEPGVQF